MTVQTETSRSGPYAGAGTTGPFTVGFRFLSDAHLQVIRTSTAGIDSTLLLTTDYTVSGAGGASGTVTLVSALATGERLTVIRDVPFTQLADYVDNDAFPAESHENALDLLTMQTQQNREVLDRSLTLPATTSGVSTELPVPEANKLIGWNETADALQNIDTATLATIVAYGTASGDIFSGDGTTTAFTLGANPGALYNLDVSIGGVDQRPTLDYTWSAGTTLTFTTAPVAGTDNISVKYKQALPQGTADAAAVTYLPAGAGAVATDVQTKLRESVSVKDFGAVGDGVTDDSNAFLVLFTHLNTIRTATSDVLRVEFPTGNYLIGAAWAGTRSLPQGCHYDFCGSTIILGAAQGSMFTIASGADIQASTVVENLCIDGGGFASNIFNLAATTYYGNILFRNISFKDITSTITCSAPYTVAQNNGGTCFSLEMDSGNVTCENIKFKNVFSGFRIGVWAGATHASATHINISNVYAEDTEVIVQTTQSAYYQDEFSYIAPFWFDSMNSVVITNVTFKNCGFSSDNRVGNLSFEWVTDGTYGPTIANYYPWAGIRLADGTGSHGRKAWKPVPYSAAYAEWSSGATYSAGNQVKITNNNTLGGIFSFAGGGGVTISGVRGKNDYDTANPDTGYKRIGAVFRGNMRNVSVSDVDVDVPCYSFVWFGSSPNTCYDMQPFNMSRNVWMRDLHNIADCTYLLYSDMAVQGSWYNGFNYTGTNPVVVDYAYGVQNARIENIKARYIGGAYVHPNLATAHPAQVTSFDNFSLLGVVTTTGYHRLGRFSQFAASGWLDDSSTAATKQDLTHLATSSVVGNSTRSETLHGSSTYQTQSGSFYGDMRWVGSTRYRWYFGGTLAGQLSATAFNPSPDNSLTLGTGALRWSVVYAATGAINTSDARAKQQIRTLSYAERAVAVRCKSLIRAFKFNDAVESKGCAARIHFGAIAQEVKEAFESEGLVAEQYAVLCYDEWDAELDADGTEMHPAGNRYGIRYDELLAFIIAAL